ncbi:hypothetical protein T09_2161 [Trichinella sp. T9]|nr:hypothetical protein T09_2161 [Trichinella sp. T9]
MRSGGGFWQGQGCEQSLEKAVWQGRDPDVVEVNLNLPLFLSVTRVCRSGLGWISILISDWSDLADTEAHFSPSTAWCWMMGIWGGGILTLIDLPCWAYCCSFALGYWVNASGGRSIDRHWPMVSSCLFTYSWSQALPDLLLFAPDGQWLDAAWSCGRFVYQLRGIYWPPPYYLLNAKRESVHFRPFGDAGQRLAEVGLPVREDQCVGATESTRRSELVFRFLSITSSCLGWTLSLPSQLFHLLPPDTKFRFVAVAMGGCGLLASKVSTFNQKYLNTTGSLQASIFVLGRSLQKQQQQQQQPEKRKSIFTKPEEALREKSSPSSVAAIFFFTKQHAFNSCRTSIIDCLPGMCRRRV